METMTYVALMVGFLLVFGLVIATGFVAYMFFESLFKKDVWEFVLLTGVVTLIGSGFTVAGVLTLISIIKAL